MPPVWIAKKIGFPLHVKRYACNGMLVSAHLEGRIRQGLNTIAKYGGKQLFSYACSARHVPTSVAGERARWRFYGHTGMHTKELGILITAAPPNRTFPVYPSIKFTLTRVADASAQTLTFNLGSFIAAVTDCPDARTHMFASVPVNADEDYYGTFADVDDARLASACVYEIMKDANTGASFLVPNVSIGQPVFDARASETLTLATDMHKRSAAHCFNATTDTSTETRTRTSATPANFFDTAVTTVSGASPGFVVDMRYKASRARATTGVPVKLVVYGSMASGTGVVTLRNSAGSAVVTVNVNSATPGWFTGTGNLAAAEGKHDIWIAGDGTNQLSVDAISCFEYLS